MLSSVKNPIKQFEWELFTIGVLLCVVGLPFSNFLMSLSQFFLIGVWLLTGDLKKKLITFVLNKNAMLIADLFLVYIFGMFYAENMADAWHEVRIKIPLLIFPMVFSWYNFHKKTIQRILSVYILAVTASTLYSFLIYLNLTSKTYTDIREISVFVSHIRLSLNVVLALVFLVWVEFENQPWIKIIRLVLGFWLLFYLIISESVTGLVILGVLIIYYLLFSGIKDQKTKYTIQGFCFLLFGFLFYLGIGEWNQFQNLEDKNAKEYPKMSSNGHVYFHDFASTQVENGHYIWRFVCWDEMELWWKNHSNQPFKGIDKKGNPQYATLLRYTTSKGLTKDYTGLNNLKEGDIIAIENGYTNYRFTHNTSLRKRIYEMFWEMDSYFKGVPPMRGSTSQRLEFWKVAINTIKPKLWAGYGTGDVQKMMQPAYKTSLLKTQPKYWLKPHQQFLTFSLQFGILQTIFILGSMLVLLFRFKKSILYVSFFVIYFLSMMTEDTLDTQAGITFYAFFQCFLVLGWKNLTPLQIHKQ